MASFFAFSGFIYFTALYLQQVRGYGPLAAGMIMLPGAVPVLACGPISGRLVATRGARSVLVGGTSRSEPAPSCWRSPRPPRRCGRSSHRRF